MNEETKKLAQEWFESLEDQTIKALIQTLIQTAIKNDRRENIDTAFSVAHSVLDVQWEEKLKKAVAHARADQRDKLKKNIEDALWNYPCICGCNKCEDYIKIDIDEIFNNQ